MNERKLPFIAEFLLKLFLPEMDFDYLYGDYVYLYNEKVESSGIFKAYFWIVKQVVKTIPAYIIHSLDMGAMMLRNYFLIAVRNILRNKVYSLINIGGFAIGLAAVLFITLYINYEVTYDQNHVNYESIYRITSNIPPSSGIKLNAPVTTGTTRDALRLQVPEVKKATRINNDQNYTFNVYNKKFIENSGFYVDQDFLEIFTVPVIDGQLNSALDKVNSIVLTKDIAVKYFGKTNIIGESIIVDDIPLKVTAVVENAFENSHIKYDFLISFETIMAKRKELFFQKGISFPTYILVESETPENVLTNVKQVAQMEVDKFVNQKMKGLIVNADVQAFSDIHLHSNLQYELEPNGSINDIYLFSLLAIVILVIAMINFINIVTAKSQLRVTEIGIRKTLGAFRKNLINQFLGESVIQTLIALIIAVIVVCIFLQPFSDLVKIPFTYDSVFSASLLIKILLFTIFAGILSGMYPALFLSKLEPSRAVKSKRALANSKSFLRRFLVISQFAVSIALMASIFVFRDQINFLKQAELGFDKEQVVVFKSLTQKLKSNINSISSSLNNQEQIISASPSSHIIGDNVNRNPVNIVVNGTKKESLINQIKCSHNYLSTLGIKIKEGRNFLKENISDLNEAAIVNEAFIKHFEVTDPIGKEVLVMRNRYKIIGVANNFHYASLKNEIEPMIINMSEYTSFLSIKLNTENLRTTLDLIKSKLQQFDPDYSSDYLFMDESFNNMYKSEELVNKLFLISAVLAVVISIVGLFALAAFTTERRTKEIGIRKVMGASVKEINNLLLKDFIYLIIIANLIALPFSYYLLEEWLTNFAYRTQISVFPFLFAATISFVVSVLSVMSQIYKAANLNPVKSIKTE